MSCGVFLVGEGLAVAGGADDGEGVVEGHADVGLGVDVAGVADVVEPAEAPPGLPPVGVRGADAAALGDEDGDVGVRVDGFAVGLVEPAFDVEVGCDAGFLAALNFAGWALGAGGADAGVAAGGELIASWAAQRWLVGVARMAAAASSGGVGPCARDVRGALREPTPVRPR